MKKSDWRLESGEWRLEMKDKRNKMGDRKCGIGVTFYLPSAICYLLFVFIISYLLSPICLSAVGATSSEFLLLPKGARAAAMSGSLASVDDGSNSIFYNPAAIGLQRQQNICLSHSEWLEDINFENIAYSMPLTKKIAVGFGIEYLGISEIEGKENQTSPTSQFNASDLAIDLGVSCSINKKIAVGLSTKYIEQKIDTEKSYSVSLDIGGIYTKKINSYRIVSIGISVENIPAKEPEFIDEVENLPTKLVTGVSYKPLDEILLLSTDLTLMKNSKPAANFGTEVFIYDILSIRAGYKLDTSFERLARITFGTGLVLGSLSVDYAYLPFEPLTDTHIFSLSFKFD
ncbi:MAG: PorV/PorQ family protein [Elusimicrobiota bacterium]